MEEGPGMVVLAVLLGMCASGSEPTQESLPVPCPHHHSCPASIEEEGF
jgi:hypothetical protein